MRDHETEALGSDEQWAEQEAWPDEAHEYPEPDESSQSQVLGTPRSKRRNRAVSMAVRRPIGVALALAMAYGVFHVVFRTDVLAPALAYVQPAKDGINWVLADPRRAWVALAALAIPHIGAYYLFFEDRR